MFPLRLPWLQHRRSDSAVLLESISKASLVPLVGFYRDARSIQESNQTLADRGFSWALAVVNIPALK